MTSAPPPSACRVCWGPVAGPALLSPSDPRFPICRGCERRWVIGAKALHPRQCRACLGKGATTAAAPPAQETPAVDGKRKKPKQKAPAVMGQRACNHCGGYGKVPQANGLQPENPHLPSARSVL